MQGLFPGSLAGASLKLLNLLCLTPLQLVLFPGSLAGASLKLRLGVRHEWGRSSALPRLFGRGLIEAGRAAWRLRRGSRLFPGSLAGASLKRRLGRRTPLRPLSLPRLFGRGLIEARRRRDLGHWAHSLFPGSLAGASLKRVMHDWQAAVVGPSSPALWPGPH